ncbi:MAG TPA: 50S ribosomal protein L25 [Anaerolineae bacterium]|nr:50S ribosomal protein L25 [Anaerolineae bacterium]
MAKKIPLQAEARDVAGTKAKQLRREGLIPGIVYGDTEPISVQMDVLELERVLRKAGTANLIELALPSETKVVLARDIQRHFTRRDLIHIDFYEVDLTKKVVSEAELVWRGKAPLVTSGMGRLVPIRNKIQIEALPEDLVNRIPVNVRGMDSLDSAIYVRDLKLPEGVIVLEDGDRLVLKCAPPIKRATVDIGAEEDDEEDEELE